MAAPRLEMCGVSKRFGATTALADVSLVVQPGEVHALVGENGAGKSTLMKILAGAVRPDAGEIRLDGQVVALHGPLAGRAAGVAMIYQELNLAPDLTVEENITLGVEHHAAGFVRPRVHRRRIAAILELLSRPELPLRLPVRRLPAAERQLVEIARALLADARVLVMDEPTSSLGPADIEQLFAVIARLQAEGVAVIYISHFLEEVQRVAQRYTVLRDGRNVGGGALAGVSLSTLVELMIGRRLDELFPRVPHAVGAPLLELQGVVGQRLPHHADLTLHRGEILGLAGLVGAGRTELLRCIYGLEPVRAGTVRIGTCVAGRGTPEKRLGQGIGMLSEDRKAEGLALTRSIADNITLSNLAAVSRWGWIRPRVLRDTAQRWAQKVDIRARSIAQPVGDLSGGNQQKTALARLLHDGVDVLLLDEPTRGVDVASKAQIYRLIGELAAQGKAILMASNQAPELLGVCDRIAVMHRGRLGPARPRAAWTEHALVSAAISGKETAA